MVQSSEQASPTRRSRWAIATLLLLGAGLHEGGPAPAEVLSRRVAVDAMDGDRSVGPAARASSASTTRPTLPPPVPTTVEPPGLLPFGISGSVAGLAPGVGTQLPLTITNDRSFAIVVTGVAGTPGAVTTGRGTCAAENLVVAPWAGELRIPRRSSRVLTVTVGLVPDADDACQGARIPIAYSGTAVKR